jgi:L,D-transpeptidase YcbB
MAAMRVSRGRAPAAWPALETRSMRLYPRASAISPRFAMSGRSTAKLAVGLLGLGGLAGVPALAAPVDAGVAGGQAEWRQNYEASPQLQVERSSVPILSQQTYVATEQAVARYRELAAQGGWNLVPAGQTLKLGMRNGAVSALRQRLMASGDLDPNAGTSPVFDSFVEAGVRRFQERHGLLPTGIVAQQTVAALNVSVEQRMRQLELNLVRLKSFTGNLGQRYVAANIPAARVETVENGVVFTHHQAGVGKIDRQSPVMNTRAIDINFNPFWTVPASIIRKDLIPKMQADPNYLNDNHIRVYSKAGQEVPSSSINWRSLEATNYMFREDPSTENSLGVVRINIANPYGVYMHDTPAKGIFGDDYRFVSSGCMRIQNVRDYVAWLLKNTPGWSREQIDQAIRSGQRVDVKIADPVPVYWVYITAWSGPDGVVQFRDDIYRRDGAVGVASSAPEASAAAYAPPPQPGPAPAVAPQRVNRAGAGGEPALLPPMGLDEDPNAPPR